MFPRGLVQRLQTKANAIYRRRAGATKENNKEETNYIIVPYRRKSEPITRLLEKTGINVAYAANLKIGNMVTPAKISEEGQDSAIYNIPCGGCTASYYGETSQSVKRRLYEHKYDLRQHKTSNSLVVHMDSHGHLPNWEAVRVLHTRLPKMTRKLGESAYINTESTTTHREGSVCLSRAAARLTLSGFRLSQPVLPGGPAG